MKELSAVEKARIKAAFEKLSPGDVIGLGDVSFVVIRYLGDRMVIGAICGCKKRHINNVFNDTFIWSDEKEALVGNDNCPPSWWSNDLLVHRGDAADIAQKSTHFPVSADYRQYTESEKDGLSDERSAFITESLELLSYSDAKEAAIRRVLENLGVTLTAEQAMLMEIIFVRIADIEEALAMRTIIRARIISFLSHESEPLH